MVVTVTGCVGPKVLSTLNQRSCSRLRQSVAVWLLFFVGFATLISPTVAHAQFSGKVSASGQFESNSNVFALESGFVPETGDFHRGDTYFAYGAELDGNYNWGREELYATAITHEYDYQRFTQLDHNDYKLDTGLNWKLGELLDGKLDIARNHTMVPFLDLSGSGLALSLLTEQRETAQLGIKLGSNWKITSSTYTSKEQEPIPAAPNLQLNQSAGSAAFQYVGIGGLAAGVTGGYLSGSYDGTNGTLNPSFRQTNAGFAATYKHNRLMFDGEAGYSHRASSDGSDNTSGFTGLFDLKEQLTPKTSLLVKIDRMINSYFLNSGSEIDTEAAAAVDWQATYKLDVLAGYTFTYRDYPRQGNDPVGSNRIDHQNYANLSIRYQPQRWLLITPYANVQKRSSNFIGGDFNATVFGVVLTVTFPDQPRR